MGIETVSAAHHRVTKSVHHHNSLNKIYKGASDFDYFDSDAASDDTEARFYKGSSDDFEQMDVIPDDLDFDYPILRKTLQNVEHSAHHQEVYTRLYFSDNTLVDRGSEHHFLNALILYELNLIRNPADFERGFEEWKRQILKVDKIPFDLDKKRRVLVSKDGEKDHENPDSFLFRLMQAKNGPYFLRDNLFDVCWLLLRGFPNSIQHQPQYQHGKNALVFSIRHRYQHRAIRLRGGQVRSLYDLVKAIRNIRHHLHR